MSVIQPIIYMTPADIAAAEKSKRKGDTGDKGPAGSGDTKGDTGDKGSTGDTGGPGAKGANGSQGQIGNKGIAGDIGINLGGITPYLVGVGLAYTTIQSAIDAATVSGGDVIIQEGTYTEDLVFKAGVNLYAYPCSKNSVQALKPVVTVVGGASMNVSSGVCKVRGILFERSASLVISLGTASILHLYDCSIIETSGSRAIEVIGSSTIFMDRCSVLAAGAMAIRVEQGCNVKINQCDISGGQINIFSTGSSIIFVITESNITFTGVNGILLARSAGLSNSIISRRNRWNSTSTASGAFNFDIGGANVFQSYHDVVTYNGSDSSYALGTGSMIYGGLIVDSPTPGKTNTVAARFFAPFAT